MPGSERPPPDASHARLTKIFRKHAGTAYRTLICSGIPQADAEDCITRVFEIVFERLANIAPHAERAIVCAVAARLAANVRRANTRRWRLFSQVEDEQWENFPQDLQSEGRGDPEHFALQAERVEELERAMARMTDRQRAVFVLCELERFTAAEAASALGVAVTAVQARRKKARIVFQAFCRQYPTTDASCKLPAEAGVTRRKRDHG